jgi:hypothetical protein
MSTYSPSLRIELITNGTQAGVWGTTTNDNLAYILDTSIAGYQTVSVTSASQALTHTSGPTATAANNQSVYAMLRFTTTTGAAFAVYAPPASKMYIIWNNSGQSMTIYNSTVIGNTTAAGTGTSITSGVAYTVATLSSTTLAQWQAFFSSLSAIPTVGQTITATATGTLAGGATVTATVLIANGSKVIVWSDGTSFYEVQASNLTGTLAIANGGTGQTTANAALNALLPVQTSNANKYLQTDGTNSSWDAISLSTADITGTLAVANGGTGQASNLTQYGVLYGSTTTAMATTLAGTSTQVLKGNSSGAPTWGSVALGADVSGTLPVANGGTGQTTQQAALNSLAGAVTSGYYLRGNGTNVSMSVLSAGDLSGTLAATNGGTGQSTVTTGDLLYGSATNTWAKLADVATGSALISGGVGIAPSYGKIGLTTHVSGTLPVANGGTGNTSQSQYAVLYAATTSSLTGDPNALSFDGTNLGIGTNSPSTYGKLTVLGTGSFTNSLVSTSATAADKPTFEFRKTRNTGATENNAIGRLSFYSQNSTTTTESAYIDVTDVRIANLPFPQISLVAYNQTIGANAASLNLGGTQTRLSTVSSSGIEYVTSGSAPHTFTGRVVFDPTRASDMPGGISNAGIITVANLATAAKPVGASQTWQDFTIPSQRTNNAVYTNSTGRPIMVSIYAYYGANQSIELKVDGITIALAGWSSFASGYVGGTVSAIVPAGSTYECYTATGVSIIQKWLELR